MMWSTSHSICRRVVGFVLATALAFISIRAVAAGEVCELQLEVFMNQAPTHLIGSFTLMAGRRMAARRTELEEIGLKPRGYGPPDEVIVLDEIVGLSYRYDEAGQQLYITVVDELRAARVLDASGRPKDDVGVRTDYGAVLNYDLFSAGSGGSQPRSYTFSGNSATLDARAFTPFGTLSQTGILRTAFAHRFDALRLDTAFTYSDRETLTTYRAGDVISGGLAWTRPIRIGGLQAQRNFGLRSDLVTLPLPAAVGSAAVPSTVDVFVNNVRTSSQEIETGPYRISNVPASVGSGSARVVLRDASGHETVTDLPFYVSPKLLAPGLFDFTVEAGMPRLSYGTTADTYSHQFVAAAGGRTGVLDWLTLEGHTEAGAGLFNGGVGAVVRTGAFGVASAAVAGSRYSGNWGLQSYLAYETAVLGVTIQASSQRTFGSYDDLASVTARLRAAAPIDVQATIFGAPFALNPLLVGLPPAALWTTARVPKALDRVSLGLPLPFDLSTLSLSYIHLNDSAGKLSDILSASWSRAFGFNATVFATAFADLKDRKNCGFLIGLSIPLGDSASASSAVSRDRNGTNITSDVVKPLGQQPGSTGWRVHDSEGKTADRSAAFAYRSSFARMEVGAREAGKSGNASAELEGAVVTMGNGVFLANRIDDAFAVIDTGVPGVQVFHENRPVGVTDSAGRALVTGLRSYQKNHIAIDTGNMPVDAEIATTQDVIAPADRSGVRVSFGVRTDTSPAILVLTGPDGQPIPAGSPGSVEGGEAFVVGYDGRAWVKGLKPENAVSVALADRTCRASFAYSPRANEQVVISPVICR